MRELIWKIFAPLYDWLTKPVLTVNRIEPKPRKRRDQATRKKVFDALSHRNFQSARQVAEKLNMDLSCAASALHRLYAAGVVERVKMEPFKKTPGHKALCYRYRHKQIAMPQFLTENHQGKEA